MVAVTPSRGSAAILTACDQLLDCGECLNRELRKELGWIQRNELKASASEYGKELLHANEHAVQRQRSIAVEQLGR